MPTPLIRLLPMSEQHYPAYCACFIEEYAQDLASNQGHDLATARHKAEASLLRYLPQGVASTSTRISRASSCALSQGNQWEWGEAV